MAKHFSESMAEIVSRTADDMYGLGKADAAEDFAATIATQAAQIEALRDRLKEARDYVGKGYMPSGLLDRIDAALSNTGKK